MTDRQARGSYMKPFRVGKWEGRLPRVALRLPWAPIWTPLGFRIKATPQPEINRWPHINGHAGDADAVSTGYSDGNVVAFTVRSEVAEGAPLMAVPFCGLNLRSLLETPLRGDQDSPL